MKKHCGKCNQTKDISEFYVYGGKAAAHCKECRREYKRSKSKGIPKGKPARPYYSYPVDDQLICYRCRERKHVDDFSPDKNKKRTRQGWCRACYSEVSGLTDKPFVTDCGYQLKKSDPCVYCLFSGDNLLYVGSSVSVNNRIRTHINDRNRRGIDRVMVHVARSELDMIVLELAITSSKTPSDNKEVYTGPLTVFNLPDLEWMTVSELV